jgi:hypothetical protein
MTDGTRLTCVRCGTDGLATNFSRLHVNGETGVCRSCENARIRAYEAHLSPEALRAKRAAHYQRRKANPKPPKIIRLDCPRCERPDLTVDDFYWNPAGSRGGYCRRCETERGRERRARNPEANARDCQKYQAWQLRFERVVLP